MWKLAGIVLAMLLVMTTSAWADVQIAGNTTGSYFNSGGQSADGGDLTFAGKSFGAFTIPNGGSQSSFVVGQFGLTDCGFCNFDDTFDLNVNFSLPGGVLGGNDPYNFTGELDGSFLFWLGGVDLTFNQWSKTFQFNNGTSQGSFTLNILGKDSDGDIDLKTGGTTNLNATITNVIVQTVVPEPTSVLLLATILVGLGLWSRKKLA